MNIYKVLWQYSDMQQSAVVTAKDSVQAVDMVELEEEHTHREAICIGTAELYFLPCVICEESVR